MSKDIKLNGEEYIGISTIQVPTSNGNTASFKDADEIMIPTGSKSITANGAYDVANFASVVVNVSSSGAVGMESGTFVGNGKQTIEIPVNSKKTHLAIWTSIPDVLALAKPYINIDCLAIEGHGITYSCANVSGNDSMGFAKAESNYTDASNTNVIKPFYCIFTDTMIKVAQSHYHSMQVYETDVTYNWVAW